MKRKVLLNPLLKTLIVVTLLVIPSYAAAEWTEIDECTSSDLNDVWASSCSNAYAVGNQGAIVQYNGSTCSEENSGTTNYLQGIWGSSPSDIYAVGYNGFISHFDGSGWNAMENTGTSNHLYAVWGCSPSDVFAVGEKGTILYYNGSTWQKMISNTDATLYGIWGSSCSKVFAVGAVDSMSSQGKPFTASATLLYNGNEDYRWEPLENKQNASFRDVWGYADCNVFAMSDAGDLIHYDCTYDEVRQSWWEDIVNNVSFSQNGAQAGISGYACSAINTINVVGMGHSFECDGDGRGCFEIMDLENKVLTAISCTTEGENVCCWAVGSRGAAFNMSTTCPTTIITTTSSTTSCRIPLCCINQTFGEDSEQAESLRFFRDEVLSKTREGQEIIRLYYEWSPLIVKMIEEDAEFEAEVREFIDGIVPMIKGELE